MVAFGPFRFDADTKVVTRDGIAVPLGSRSQLILEVLAGRPGELVTHRELIEVLWPARGGDAASLRVHVSALRRALGDLEGAYIINEHGRGYRLLTSAAGAAQSTPDVSPDTRHGALPFNLSPVIGRDAAIDAVLDSLAYHRLVSLVGPGGIGKTTLAIEVARRYAPGGGQGVSFVDLSALAAGDTLPVFIAATSGMISDAAPMTPTALAELLASRKLLLVLDNCEHLIGEIASLVEAVLAGAPGVTILATSREVLGLSREKVHRLSGISVPPPDELLTTEQIMQYSAIQLLAERAAALSDVALSDADITPAAILCRRLDGIPLAIELAAGWVGAIGLDDIAHRLDDQFVNLPDGRRGGAARHRTLSAVLDWSFELLSPAERDLLERLSVFRGSFALESAAAVAGDQRELAFAELLPGLTQLVSKSLVMARPGAPQTRYHLLETTRGYAWQRLSARPEVNAVSRRHALHVADLLAGLEADGLTLSRPALTQRYGPLLGDVRAALAWSLGPAGDAALAVEIIGSAVPMGLRYWQPDEFVAKLEQGLQVASRLGPDARRQTVRLSYQIGHILNQVVGDTGRLRATLDLIQQTKSSSDEQFPEQIMAEWVGAFTLGRYPTTLALAEQLAVLAARTQDEIVSLLADRVMAQSLHFLGRHRQAAELAQRVLDCRFEHLPYSQIGHRTSMRIVLARIRFLEGDADLAEALAGEALVHARQSNAISFSQALALCSIPLAIWSGRIDQANAMIDEMQSVAANVGLSYWERWAQDLRRLSSGTTVNFLDDPTLSPKLVDFALTMQPQVLSGRARERLAAGDAGWCAPEGLRALAAAARARGDDTEARRLLGEAGDLAASQGATAWLIRVERDLSAIPPQGPASPSDQAPRPARRKPSGSNR
jgi:predicted ATPase/DNA-binding winged helix-turn-helix (wHTH) protein